MGEHLANGQFARKELSEDAPTKTVTKSGRFQKGHSKLGGRAKGTPNRTTRAVKEFLAELVDDPEVQEAVRGRIVKGDAVAFFRALENVVGKPKENAGEPIKIEQTMKWADE